MRRYFVTSELGNLDQGIDWEEEANDCLSQCDEERRQNELYFAKESTLVEAFLRVYKSTI